MFIHLGLFEKEDYLKRLISPKIAEYVTKYSDDPSSQGEKLAEKSINSPNGQKNSTSTTQYLRLN